MLQILILCTKHSLTNTFNPCSDWSYILKNNFFLNGKLACFLGQNTMSKDSIKSKYVQISLLHFIISHLLHLHLKN